jgi:hypothetical protein
MILIAVVVICMSCCCFSILGGGGGAFYYMMPGSYTQDECDELEKWVVFNEDELLPTARTAISDKSAENIDSWKEKQETNTKMYDDFKDEYGSKKATGCDNDLNKRMKTIIKDFKELKKQISD